MNKKGFVDIETILSPTFIILTVVGYIAFGIMLFVLKGMEQTSIMPLWVKIITIVAVPIIAYLFSLMQ